MTTPLDAYYLRYNFSLNRAGTVEDIAVFGLWMNTPGSAEYGDDELGHCAHGGYKAWADEVDTGYWTDAVTLESVTASSYLANGHTLHEQNYVPSTPWQGAGPAPSLPWETAMAISLYTYPRGTFVTNGKRKRGRFYLPPFSASTLDHSNSGYFLDSNFHTFVANMRAFLVAAQDDELGVPVGALGVFSRMDSVIRPVVQVSADAKIDSQRRRQNRETAGTYEVAF